MIRTSLLIGFLGLAGVTGCRGETSKERPIFGIRHMFDQQKYDTQEQSEFFADGRTMRPLVEGVVARDQEVDPRISEGLLEDGTGYVLTVPQEAVDHGGGMTPLLKRGQERYNIYCSACHGESGTGEGVVKQRAQAGGAAAFVPANLHDERIRHIPDGQLFATISHGKGNMAPYSHSVPVQDRWAITAYVRALQMVAPKVTIAAPQPVPAGASPGTAAGASSGTAAGASSGTAAGASSGAAAGSGSTQTTPPAQH